MARRRGTRAEDVVRRDHAAAALRIVTAFLVRSGYAECRQYDTRVLLLRTHGFEHEMMIYHQPLCRSRERTRL